MSLPKHNPTGSTSSLYSSHPSSLSSEYINIAPSPSKPEDRGQTFPESGDVNARPSITYLPPPFPPPSYDPTVAARLSFLQRHRRFMKIMVYLLMLILVTAALMVPVFLWRGRWAEERKGTDDLRLHLSIWILASWGFFMLSNLLINLLPYGFRVFARLFNPGWIKYWRVFRFMRFASTMLGGVLGTYCSFVYVSLIPTSP